MKNQRRTDKKNAELCLIQLGVDILHSQLGYWKDLQYDQGDESLYKVERIAKHQNERVAKKLYDWVSTQ